MKPVKISKPQEPLAGRSQCESMLSKLPGEPQAFPHPGRRRSGGRKEKYWKEKTVLAFKHGCKEGTLKAPSTASTSNYMLKTSHRA